MLSKGTPNTIDKKLAKQMTISFTSFDISKLYFTTLEENDRSKGQKIAYPRYEHNNEYPLLIQFPWFQLSSYGIPRLGEYYKDDSQRLFIKIPLDQSISEIKNFSNFSLIELKPITGRTHQLRVHCKEIGNPIINDIKYGGKEVINRKISARMCLHSQYIAIEKYYEDGSSLEIKDNSTPDFLKNI